MYLKSPISLKRFIYTILLIIILQASFSFYKDYKNHILNAPEHLKEANKDYIIAKIFANYNEFILKIFRIQTDNILLFPIREPMLYFYNRGLSKLDKDEPIRALWFTEFRIRMYNHSNNGKYGSMARDYGYKYAKKFVDETYLNMKLFNKEKEKLKNYYLSGYRNELTSTLLQDYLVSISVYTNEYHLSVRGFPMSKKNFDKVSSHLNLYEKFKNVYNWRKEFISYYKSNYLNEFNTVINPNRGWYSDYRDYYLYNLKISSYILFFEISNNVFDCKKSKKYIDEISSSKKIMRDFVKKYNVSLSNKNFLEKIISYLDIKNISSENFEKNKNPLKLTISCKY